MMTLISYFGALCFAICAIPQAYTCYRQGHCRGISPIFLTLWICGEISLLIYSLHLQNLPLLLNYAANALSLSVIVFYKLSPRSK